MTCDPTKRWWKAMIQVSRGIRKSNGLSERGSCEMKCNRGCIQAAFRAPHVGSARLEGNFGRLVIWHWYLQPDVLACVVTARLLSRKDRDAGRQSIKVTYPVVLEGVT